MPRGGRREGAGRPAKEEGAKRKAAEVQLHPRVLTYLDSREGRSRSRKVETLVLVNEHRSIVLTDELEGADIPAAEVLELRGAWGDADGKAPRDNWLTRAEGRELLDEAPEPGQDLWALFDDGGRDGPRWFPVT